MKTVSVEKGRGGLVPAVCGVPFEAPSVPTTPAHSGVTQVLYVR